MGPTSHKQMVSLSDNGSKTAHRELCFLGLEVPMTEVGRMMNPADSRLAVYRAKAPISVAILDPFCSTASKSFISVREIGPPASTPELRSWNIHTICFRLA
jgi:hypothetical protein